MTVTKACPDQDLKIKLAIRMDKPQNMKHCGLVGNVTMLSSAFLFPLEEQLRQLLGLISIHMLWKNAIKYTTPSGGRQSAESIFCLYQKAPANLMKSVLMKCHLCNLDAAEQKKKNVHGTRTEIRYADEIYCVTFGCFSINSDI